MCFLFFVVRALGVAWHKELPHYFHAGVRWILGINVVASGEMRVESPVLFLSNHISYLDVFVLGGVRAYFVAKSEVANWPVLGPMSKFQNTLFFERRAGMARHQIEVMRAHLAEGQNLILFPEGTSTNGTHIVPFKSSLLEAAKLKGDRQRVAIQPVTLAYVRHAGLPMNQAVRDNYAWYAKMPFTSHFFNLFTLKTVDVKMHFHAVVYLDEFANRKECAEYCSRKVAEKLDEFLL